jgi:predicted alpha/beta hydrolase family esterase
MLSALLQLAPAFASVTASMEDAAAAADTLANRVTAAQSTALASVNDQITAAKAQASAATQAAGAYRQITGSLVDAIARIRGTQAVPARGWTPWRGRHGEA